MSRRFNNIDKGTVTTQPVVTNETATTPKLLHRNTDNKSFRIEHMEMTNISASVTQRVKLVDYDSDTGEDTYKAATKILLQYWLSPKETVILDIEDHTLPKALWFMYGVGGYNTTSDASAGVAFYIEGSYKRRAAD